MFDTPLPPEWVTMVPARYGSLAHSIEGWYRRLVCDPPAIYELGQLWWDQSRKLEQVWQGFNRDRQQRMNNWEGEAAEAFDAQADVWVGLVSATSKSLNFASVGLHLLSGEMPKFELTARTKVFKFIKDVNREYRQWLVNYYRSGGRLSVGILDAEVLILARNAQLVVYQQADALDTLLASMPNRFRLGPDATWAEGIGRTNASFDVDATRHALSGHLENLVTGGGALEMDIVVLNDIDGDVIVAVPFEGDATLGTKGGLDNFPDKFHEEIRRYVTAKYDVGATGKYKYTQSYLFEDPAEAKKFVEKLTTGDRSQRFREGFHARQGDGLMKPHSLSITVELEGGGEAKGGLQVPLGGDQEELQGSARAAGAGAGSVTLTTLADGQWARTYVRRSSVRGDVEGGLGETATAQYDLEGGYQEIVTKVEFYDEEDKPLKFIEQTTKTTDHLKKTTTYGLSGAPWSKENVETGLNGESSEGSDNYRAATATKTLDLTEPENAEAWKRRFAQPGAWRDWFNSKGVKTYREEEAQSNTMTKSIAFEAVTPILGLKEVSGERVNNNLYSQLDSSAYLDRVREPGYGENPVYWRPHPQYPAVLRDDVPAKLQNPDRRDPDFSDGRSIFGGIPRNP